jgi:hypothetical protein
MATGQFGLVGLIRGRQWNVRRTPARPTSHSAASDTRARLSIHDDKKPLTETVAVHIRE